MNSKMSALLKRTGLRWPVPASAVDFPALEVADGCVLLKNQWQPNKPHVKIEDFPDKTGFECFINHVHFPFAGTKESLMPLLTYGVALTRSLVSFALDRKFRVIISISKSDGTVRFHEIRPMENWINEDLEGYESEAILVFDVPVD